MSQDSTSSATVAHVSGVSAKNRFILEQLASCAGGLLCQGKLVLQSLESRKWHELLGSVGPLHMGRASVRSLGVQIFDARTFDTRPSGAHVTAAHALCPPIC